jgi:methylmalonyl-CoA mutase
MDTTAESAPDDLVLAAEFPTATRAEWLRLVARVLERSDPAGAADPENALSTLLPDGILVAPLYTAADAPALATLGEPGEAPFVRGRTPNSNRGGWDVRVRQTHPDAKTANAQILEDLSGGATSVWLGLGPGGVPVDALPEALADVLLNLVTVVLDAGTEGRPAAERFLATAADRWVMGPDVHACLGLDPLGLLARTGDPSLLGTGLSDAMTLALHASRYLPNVRALVVDGLAYHEAGATDAEELGCTLAAGVEYLRALGSAGVAIDEGLGQLDFRYAATADQFATIAKFRAARRVWAKVALECGVSGPGAGQRQHAVTSWSMTTRRDPWNNILRGTLAALSAGVGGADAVTVLPFDAALGLPDALARRVARNTSALLIEEAHVARVIDPAGGSWYVESLTEALAQSAWAWFQEIERAGGMRAALVDGLVAERIAASRERRMARVAHREDAVTGVSAFPLRGERLLERFPDPASTVRQDPGQHALPRVRWAQWHEELRDRADAFAEATGSPPTVPVRTVGGVRGAAARAGELTALLAPVGVEVTVLTQNHGVPLAASAPQDPAPASPSVAAVCCADDAATEDIAAAVADLRAGGAARVVLVAGPDVEGSLGVDDVVDASTDALAFGRGVLDDLGVPA